MMFPRDQYRDAVTLFTPRRDDETGQIRYFRRVLSRCFWHSKSIAVNGAGGIAAPDRVELHIPLRHNPGYVNRAEWNALPLGRLNSAWTVQPGSAVEWTIIIKGEDDFPQLEEWLPGEESGRRLAAFRREFGASELHPAEVNEILYGGAGMHRLDVIC